MDANQEIMNSSRTLNGHLHKQSHGHNHHGHPEPQPFEVKKVPFDLNKIPKKRKQRRSYNCGPCKKQKIKCDMLVPCSACVRYKREDKCIEDPANPPSPAEMAKKLNKKKMNKSSTMISQLSSGNVHAFDYDFNNAYTGGGFSGSSGSFFPNNRRSIHPQSNQILLPMPTNTSGVNRSESLSSNFQHQHQPQQPSFSSTNTAKFPDSLVGSRKLSTTPQLPSNTSLPLNLQFKSNSLSNIFNPTIGSMEHGMSGQWDQFPNIQHGNHANSIRPENFYGGQPNQGSILDPHGFGQQQPERASISNIQSGESSITTSSPLDDPRGMSNRDSVDHSSFGGASKNVDSVSDLKSSLLLLQARINELEKSSDITSHQGQSTGTDSGDLQMNNNFLSMINSLPKKFTIDEKNLNIQFQLGNSNSNSSDKFPSITASDIGFLNKPAQRESVFKLVLGYLPFSYNVVQELVSLEDKFSSFVDLASESSVSVMQQYEKFWSFKHLVNATNVDFLMVSEIFLRLARGLMVIPRTHPLNTAIKLCSEESFSNLGDLSKIWFKISVNCLEFASGLASIDTMEHKYKKFELFIKSHQFLEFLDEIEESYTKFTTTIGQASIANMHDSIYITEVEEDPEFKLKRNLWLELNLIDFEMVAKLGKPHMINTPLPKKSDVSTDRVGHIIHHDRRLDILSIFQRNKFNYTFHNFPTSSIEHFRKIFEVDRELNQLAVGLEVGKSLENPKFAIRSYLDNANIMMHKLKIFAPQIHNSGLANAVYLITLNRFFNFYRYLRQGLSQRDFFADYYMMADVNFQALLHQLIFLIFKNHSNCIDGELELTSKSAENNMLNDIDMVMRDMEYLDNDLYCVGFPRIKNDLKLLESLRAIYYQKGLQVGALDNPMILLDSVNSLDGTLVAKLSNNIGGDYYFSQLVKVLSSANFNGIISEKMKVNHEMVLSGQSEYCGFSPSTDMVNEHISYLRVGASSLSSTDSLLTPSVSVLPLNELEWNNINVFKNQIQDNSTTSGLKALGEKGKGDTNTALGDIVLNSSYNYRY